MEKEKYDKMVKLLALQGERIIDAEGDIDNLYKVAKALNRRLNWQNISIVAVSISVTILQLLIIFKY